MTSGGLPDPPRRATYADILALPENVVGEIIQGDLVVSPRPAPPPRAGFVHPHG